ncbi:hypothetical protein NDU88_006189 [Pleurodeles waltl]|uniref:Uncharacterized protein n=1 Tax=Pleurodeles waltl TaxID=8319 RepID=A0AAV7PKC8_PLEWA|nr:hypothetical protein NDU88_006189 [Pleurodeles waltl]
MIGVAPSHLSMGRVVTDVIPHHESWTSADEDKEYHKMKQSNNMASRRWRSRPSDLQVEGTLQDDPCPADSGEASDDDLLEESLPSSDFGEGGRGTSGHNSGPDLSPGEELRSLNTVC